MKTTITCLWDQIPTEILGRIMDQLNLLDCVRLRVVCKSWRSLVSLVHNQNKKISPPWPWLLLPHDQTGAKYLKFFDFSGAGSFYDLPLPKASSGSSLYCCGSSKAHNDALKQSRDFLEAGYCLVPADWDLCLIEEIADRLKASKSGKAASSKEKAGTEPAAETKEGACWG
ncbi:hypothetical protein EZV62_011434 [Acer yangbiense]|uniref:F-box domain-containing protein n=1 Tax=Acer yangbiense TaxID=1000413 RepID=A0A5C7I555_9ROSI|nr:hypothetical protein EZV62_011434 [Acer yangbiense]